MPCACKGWGQGWGQGSPRRLSWSQPCPHPPTSWLEPRPNPCTQQQPMSPPQRHPAPAHAPGAATQCANVQPLCSQCAANAQPLCSQCAANVQPLCSQCAATRLPPFAAELTPDAAHLVQLPAWGWVLQVEAELKHGALGTVVLRGVGRACVRVCTCGCGCARAFVSVCVSMRAWMQVCEW